MCWVRPEREVTHFGASRITPEGAHLRNPAFDVTPAKYVSAIITERGMIRAIPARHSFLFGVGARSAQSKHPGHVCQPATLAT